jgi:hypothetical protein
MRIFYLPLEPYKERYTEQLDRWTLNRWGKDSSVTLVPVYGDAAQQHISTGTVLDAHGRPKYAASQVARLVGLLASVVTSPEDVIYFEDMFTPGFEAIPYIFDQLPPQSRPRVYVRNYAQSVDPHDFTHSMRRWMRKYEEMVYETVDGVFCASTAHEQLMRVAGLPTHHVHVVGLPFDLADVLQTVSYADRASTGHAPQVIYSSRLDAEKNPHFLCDLISACSEIDFLICTGAEDIRSNDASVLERLRTLEKQQRVRVQRRSTKKQYYAQLACSRVQLNTAYQDFVSFTALEASAFGVPTLAPAYMSFPEALRKDPSQLYIPNSVEDASKKLRALLDDESSMRLDPTWLSRVHDKTLDRMMSVFKGQPYTAWAGIK